MRNRFEMMIVGTRFGAAAVGAVVPGQLERQLGSGGERSPAATVLARLFAARDVGYGLGVALSEPPGRRLWLAVGVATDLADAATMAIAFATGSLSRPRATSAGAVAFGAAALGVAALQAH